MDSSDSEVYRVQPNGMRLINTETLELQKFPEGSIPPYAILSHVWGDMDEDDECCFQDFNGTKTHSDKLKSKKGYAKIINFCRKAQEHGHAWAWADTVCIDKTTYEEHNTAVNCMFAWYKQSEACFVYLQDVEYCGPVVKDFGSVKTEESDLPHPLLAAIKQSSWFQRGWTLQEFIAPTRLSFFSREWNLTFVRDDVINGHELDSDVPDFWRRQGCVYRELSRELPAYSAAARMLWVSKRYTRYLEDEAYCLLGIFGVQMPIRYGEGAQAFKRLQSLIMSVKQDPTLLMWSQTSAWSVPRGLAPTSYLATSPSLFRIVDHVRLHHGKGDLWMNVSLEREVTDTAASSRLNRDFVMYRPLISTIDNRVSLIAMGDFESPRWLNGCSGEVFVPVISEGASRYRRANLPIIRADLRSTRIISVAPPTKIRLDDVAGNIARDILGSAKTESNARDTRSIDDGRLLVMFPLGLGGYSFLAAFPGVESSAPGTISMVESGLFHCAILVLETNNPSSRIGFLFVAEIKETPAYYGARPKHVTCRVLKEEFWDVSKLGLQRVLEHHISRISLALQKHNDLTQAFWRRTDRLGKFYTEIGHFDGLFFAGKNEPGPGGLRDEYPDLEGPEGPTLILTAIVVLNYPETETRRKILALHHANCLMGNNDG